MFGWGLRYDKKHDEWKGSRRLRSRKIEVRVDGSYDKAEAKRVLDEAIAKVEGMWSKVEENLVDNLLELFNDTWRQEDEASLSAEELLAKVVIETLEVTDEEAITLWFHDADLFGGHAIEIFIDTDGTIGEATLMG